MQPTVLVVGGGPVGLTMAAELARYGLSVRVIDKAPQRTDKSKALVLWSRTLELLDAAGCGQIFLDAGFRVTGANIFASNKQIAHVNFDHIDTPHPYALMLPQCDTERLLDQHLATCGVTLERQVELVRYQEESDRVVAVLRHADGREETVAPSWLIGCDGAHSTVRHLLNVPFEGETLRTDWILADVHLTGDLERAGDVNTYWHHDGVLVLFPISPGRYRVIADVGTAVDGPHRPDPTLAEVQELLDGRGPGGITAVDPVWLAAFRINERKVAEYRHGRVFLAGDAAHIHSPAGGQGMNTGMQDAFNLAWKLALVERGIAADHLLDSYSVERSEIGRQVLSDAGRVTMIATLKSGVLQSVRNFAAGVVFGLSPVRHKVAEKLTELSIGYPHSPLTISSHRSHAGPKPGERAPVSERPNPADAATSPRFTIYATPTPEWQALVSRHPNLLAPQLAVPYQDDTAWLVRPDGYVAMVVAHENDRAIDDYLMNLQGTPVAA